MYAGEPLEQTLMAPPTPLREIRLYAVPPWPATVVVRLRDMDQSPAGLLLVSETRVDDGGAIRIRIPGTVDTSRRSLRVQVVNPPGSNAPLILQASRVNPYLSGHAAAHDDPGAGNVDLVLRTWRRVTLAALAFEVWRAHMPGAVFVIVTVGIVAGVALPWLRIRTARWPLPTLLMASLLMLTAGMLLARVGFESLAPWSA